MTTFAESISSYNASVSSLQADLKAIALLRAHAKLPIETVSFEAKKKLWNAASRLSRGVKMAIKANPDLLFPLISFASDGAWGSRGAFEIGLMISRPIRQRLKL